MDENMRFVARQGFITREIAGEYMLVPGNLETVHLSDGTDLPEFNGIIELNELSLFLFELLKEPKTIKQLIEEVKKEFDTEGQDISEDIEEFLETGFKNQIIFILNGQQNT